MEEEYINTVFSYEMKNGRKVTRIYCLERGDVLDALETLSEDEDFRRELFPIFRTETDEASAVRIRDVYGMAENLDLDKGQREALIEAYKKDVMEVDMKTLAEATPLGELLLDYPDSSTYALENAQTVSVDSIDPGSENILTVGGFYLYEGYDNTLACLEEYGCTLRTQIDPADVSSITLYLSQESVQSGKFTDLLSELSTTDVMLYDDGSEEITVRSREEIGAVLEHAVMFNAGILERAGAWETLRISILPMVTGHTPIN